MPGQMPRGVGIENLLICLQCLNPLSHSAWKKVTENIKRNANNTPISSDLMIFTPIHS